VHFILKLLSKETKNSLLTDLEKISNFNLDYEDAKYIYRKQDNFTIDQKLKYIVNYVDTSQAVDDVLDFYIGSSEIASYADLNNIIYMSKDDLKKLRLLGHRVKPHGHTHRILGQMNKAQLQYEFQSMIDIHNEFFNEKVDEICVPYGSRYSWSKECEGVAKEFNIKKVLLVDNIATILPSFSDEFNYQSRTDCCLIKDFEYIK
jgi:hypothetical protein